MCIDGSCAPVLFVTSTTYQGSFGGAAFADASCQAHANSVGLGGTYKAVLSESATDYALNRLNHPAKRIVLANGQIFADEWSTMLAIGAVKATALLTEKFGQPQSYTPPSTCYSVPLHFWSGMGSEGAPGTQNCQGWTSSGPENGYAGRHAWDYTVTAGYPCFTLTAKGTYTLYVGGNVAPCSATLGFLCMEQ